MKGGGGGRGTLTKVGIKLPTFAYEAETMVAERDNGGWTRVAEPRHSCSEQT